MGRSAFGVWGGVGCIYDTIFSFFALSRAVPRSIMPHLSYCTSPKLVGAISHPKTKERRKKPPDRWEEGPGFGPEKETPISYQNFYIIIL